jgi:hypothetical protein
MNLFILKMSPLPILKLLGPSIRLRIFFSNAHSLHSCLKIRDYVLQPYSITDNIIDLYILIFRFLEKVEKAHVFDLSNNIKFML